MELHCEGADGRLLHVWQTYMQDRQPEETLALEVDLEILHALDNASYLEYLSQAMLRQPSHTLKIAEAYHPLLVELVSRWWAHTAERHRILGALSQLVHISPVLKDICMAFIEKEEAEKWPAVESDNMVRVLI